MSSTNDKKKKTFIRTPKVTFQYAHLSRPDQKYNRYSVQVTASEEVLGDVVATIDQYIEDTFPPKAVKHKAFRRGYTRNDDGTITIKAGTKQGFECLDIRGNPAVAEKMRIAGGTTGKLKVEVVAQADGDKPGITLYLSGVQIINLKSYASGGFGDASDELGEDEEGYVADEADVAEARRAIEARKAARKDAKGGSGEPAAPSADADDAAEDF